MSDDGTSQVKKQKSPGFLVGEWILLHTVWRFPRDTVCRNQTKYYLEVLINGVFHVFVEQQSAVIFLSVPRLPCTAIFRVPFVMTKWIWYLHVIN